jgi:hypothetical protein
MVCPPNGEEVWLVELSPAEKIAVCFGFLKLIDLIRS